MIFVDTSVWVAFFRGRTPEVAAELRRLLDDDQVAVPVPVRAELLSGASLDGQARIKRSFAALPTFFPSRDTWALLDNWIARATRARERFGVGDMLIGALAAERGGRVWSADDDFTRMSRLGLLRIHRPGRAD
jgi:predicted nucleic acid-binding protein